MSHPRSGPWAPSLRVCLLLVCAALPARPAQTWELDDMGRRGDALERGLLTLARSLAGRELDYREPVRLEGLQLDALRRAHEASPGVPEALAEATLLRYVAHRASKPPQATLTILRARPARVVSTFRGRSGPWELAATVVVHLRETPDGRSHASVTGVRALDGDGVGLTSAVEATSRPTWEREPDPPPAADDDALLSELPPRAGLDMPLGDDPPVAASLNLAVYPPRSAQAYALFELAARRLGVPDPRGWARSPGLHNLLDRESDGRVGRPNYTYGERAADPARWAAIHAELRRGRISSGMRVRGKFVKSSATGLGQLLLKNVDRYYPDGRAGIGDPLNEAIGMLAYIRDRYGDPDQAWAEYGRHHEGY